jgi:hypothetical protein
MSEHVAIAVIAALPAMVAAISSMMNGMKLRQVKPDNFFNGKSFTVCPRCKHVHKL